MRILSALLLCLYGCSDPTPLPLPPDPAPDLAVAPQPDLTVAPQPDLTQHCRAPGPADRARKVVISRPYDSTGAKADLYEVLELSPGGDLRRPGVTFRMGRSTDGAIHFTPDGGVGLVVQEDGTLGVFRLSAQGAPEVVHAAFKGRFYAGRLVLDPSGEGAYVLDSQWRENGGGVYRVRIACDGTLSEDGMLAPAKLPRGMALLSGGRAVLAAVDLLGSAAGLSLHLWSPGPPPMLLGGADAFGDADAMVSSVAVTADERYALVADNDEFSGRPNRVAVVALAPSPRPLTALMPVRDPVDLVRSPYGNALLVLSGYGNAVLRVSYDPAAAAPFALQGEPMYQGKRPQLPSSAIAIDRGGLRGRILLSENVGVRQLRFEADGAVTDLGLFGTGDGLDAIVGALGVQP